MGLTNIQTEIVHIEDFAHSFEWDDCPGAGFSFPCDKNGHVHIENYHDASIENLAMCLFGFNNVTYRGIDDFSRSFTIKTGKCKCGRTVELGVDFGHGIDCECGRIYNSCGQELAPRSQWTDRYDEDSTQPYNVEFGYVGSDY